MYKSGKKRRTNNMTKELSIENIKKEIIDKLMNNMDILKYLNAERLLNEGYKISNLYNNLIYDYDIPDIEGNYIAVEVAEYTKVLNTNALNQEYTVSIKMGLIDKKYLDSLASVVKKIITELYPHNKRFSNVPLHTKRYGYNNNIHHELNRVITFEIEEII